jgi:hypothetical protein
MDKTKVISALGLAAALLMPSALGQEPRYTILEAHHAKAVSLQCSRANPPAFRTTWKPGAAQIKALEDNWDALRETAPALCCNNRARVGDIGDYYRQYLGIVVGDRRLIYINAFESRFLDRVETRKGRWRRMAMVICDGGESFWGAVYDPATGTFSELAFNGMA